MSYKTFVSMNIAVVGVSDIAQSYALALACAGHNVYLCWKEGEQGSLNPMLLAYDEVQICSIEDAAAVSDLIIIATSPIHVREVAYWLGDVRRKVIIDATCNVFTKADEQVRTVCAIKAITGSQHIVKAFHTKGYEQILTPLFRDGLADLMLVGDSKKAKEVTKILAAELGLTRFHDFGDDSSISLFNAMTTAWRELAAKSPAPKTLPVAVSR